MLLFQITDGHPCKAHISLNGRQYYWLVRPNFTCLSATKLSLQGIEQVLKVSISDKVHCIADFKKI